MFLQAVDGIRAYKVTGVQTCALPIWASSTACSATEAATDGHGQQIHRRDGADAHRIAARAEPRAGHAADPRGGRSEERRVGVECWARTPSAGCDGTNDRVATSTTAQL